MFRKYPILTLLLFGHYLLFATQLASLEQDRINSTTHAYTYGTGYPAIYILQLFVGLILAMMLPIALIKAPRENRRILWLMLGALLFPHIILKMIVMVGG